MVCDVGRDLVEFADERDIETILIAGRWEARRRGFLTKDERDVGLKARCTVIVSLPVREPR